MAEEEPKNLIKPDFSDKNAVKMLRDLAGIAKRADVRSVVVMTVTADNFVDWHTCMESEHHACLIALALEDAREDVKAGIFNEPIDG